MLLTPYPFGEALLPLVMDFECGTAPWEIDVAAWIKDKDNGAIAYLANPARPCWVWIYLDEQDRMVGYGSLGTTRWGLYRDDGRFFKERIQIVPYFGVRSAYHGIPKDQPRQRPAFIIFNDLVEKARQHQERGQFLGLYCHRGNAGALKFYKDRFGFSEIPSPSPKTDPDNVALLLRLPT